MSRKKDPRDRQSERLLTTVTPAEDERVKAYAAAEGLTVSELLRALLEREGAI